MFKKFLALALIPISFVSYLNYKASAFFSSTISSLKEKKVNVDNINYKKKWLGAFASFNASYQAGDLNFSFNVQQQINYLPFLLGNSDTKEILSVNTKVFYENAEIPINTKIGFIETISESKIDELHSDSIDAKNIFFSFKKELKFHCEYLKINNIIFNEISHEGFTKISRVLYDNLKLTNIVKDNNQIIFKANEKKCQLKVDDLFYSRDLFKVLSQSKYNFKAIYNEQFFKLRVNPSVEKISDFEFNYSLSLPKYEFIKVFNIHSPYILRYLNSDEIFEKVFDVHNMTDNVFSFLVNMGVFVKENRVYKINIKKNKKFLFVNNIPVNNFFSRIDVFKNNLAFYDNYDDIPKHKDLYALVLGYVRDSKIVSDYGVKLAVKLNNLRLLKKLLKNDVNQQGIDGTTALYWAVKFNKRDLILYLLVNNADVNITTNKGGWAPLHEACEANNVIAAKMLIDSGAKINILDKNKQTPFHLAVKSKSRDVINYFFEKKYEKKHILETET